MSLEVQQASHAEGVLNWAPRQAQDWVYFCSTVASQNLAYYDNFLVTKSIAAFAIFRGQYQDTP